MNLTTLAYFSPGPWELLLIGGIILLLFGSRLPGAMRSLGRSFVEFKKGVRDEEQNSDPKAVAACVAGLDGFNAWRLDTMSHLDAAIAADPDFATPKLAKAWVLQLARSHAYTGAVRALRDDAARCLAEDSERDGAYLDALDAALAGNGVSTASQTAWALLALMAVGETASPHVQRGIDYLVRTQNEVGEWDDEVYTGTGFPRVFYLRYHGYSRYFPVWALATYARARQGMPTRQDEVIKNGPIDLGPIPVLSPLAAAV